MRERSSPQGELDEKAPVRPPSVLPPAAATGHLSPLAILVGGAPPVNSLGSPRVVSCVFSDFLDGLLRLSGCPCGFFYCVKQVEREREPSWFRVKPIHQGNLFEGGREPSPFLSLHRVIPL